MHLKQYHFSEEVYQILAYFQYAEKSQFSKAKTHSSCQKLFRMIGFLDPPTMKLFHQETTVECWLIWGLDQFLFTQLKMVIIAFDKCPKVLFEGHIISGKNMKLIFSASIPPQYLNCRAVSWSQAAWIDVRALKAEWVLCQNPLYCLFQPNHPFHEHSLIIYCQ